MANRILTPQEAAESFIKTIDRVADENKLSDAQRIMLFQAIVGWMLGQPFGGPADDPEPPQ